MTSSEPYALFPERWDCRFTFRVSQHHGITGVNAEVFPLPLNDRPGPGASRHPRMAGSKHMESQELWWDGGGTLEPRSLGVWKDAVYSFWFRICVTTSGQSQQSEFRLGSLSEGAGGQSQGASGISMGEQSPGPGWAQVGCKENRE